MAAQDARGLEDGGVEGKKVEDRHKAIAEADADNVHNLQLEDFPRRHVDRRRRRVSHWGLGKSGALFMVPVLVRHH